MIDLINYKISFLKFNYTYDVEYNEKLKSVTL